MHADARYIDAGIVSQAPLQSLQSDGVAAIKNDVYKVTAALIETMDFQIGRVLDALNATGMLPTTVIGFSSDNGGQS